MRSFWIFKLALVEKYIYLQIKKIIDGISFYSKELQCLEKHGYHFVKEGDIWHAV